MSLGRSIYDFGIVERAWQEIFAAKLKAAELALLGIIHCVFQRNDMLVICSVYDLFKLAEHES